MSTPKVPSRSFRDTLILETTGLPVEVEAGLAGASLVE